MTEPADRPDVATHLVRIVGFLVCVEIASGVLQGYYTPIWKDVAGHLSMRDADVNWFEAAQLVVAALVVPPLARLGDTWGHKKVLLLSTAVTALGSAVLAVAPNFVTFLVGFALQAAYIVWLPMEISIIHRRTAGGERRDVLTRRGAAVLVGALELSVIAGALTSGTLVEATSMTVLLAIPAVVVVACFVLVLLGVEDSLPTGRRGGDPLGLALGTAWLGLVMAGLIAMRVQGAGSPLAWILVVAGLAAAVPFARHEAAHPTPLVDVRVLTHRGQWPVQLASFLFGASILGSQIPLSTFARTDPAGAGYGLGATASTVSLLVGLYVISLAVGALCLPLTTRLAGPRGALTLGAALAGLGYALWLPFHDTTTQAVTNMVVVGLGSGVLVAALPAAAAAAAPDGSTGVVTGMTNAVRTVGGAIASAVFAIALSATGSVADPLAGHAPLSGYLTVWTVCAASALGAAAALALLPRRAVTGPRTAPA